MTIGAIRNTSDVVGTLDKDGKSMQDKFAEALGTFSTEEATKRGTASGIMYDSWDDRLLKVLGLDYQRAIQDVAYSEAGKIRTPEWADSTIGRFLYKHMDNEIRKYKEMITVFDPTDSAESRIQSQFTFDATQSLLQKNSLKEVLTDMGVADDDMDKAYNNIVGILVSNKTSNQKTNEP